MFLHFVLMKDKSYPSLDDYVLMKDKGFPSFGLYVPVFHIMTD